MLQKYPSYSRSLRSTSSASSNSSHLFNTFTQKLISVGLTALRTEIMLSKMKDAYFHGTESYFTAKNQERQHFRDQIQAAEAYAETAPEHDAYAAVLYGQLRGARIAYGGLPTCRP